MRQGHDWEKGVDEREAAQAAVTRSNGSEPGSNRTRPLFSYAIDLWNARKPTKYGDLRQVIGELVAHDADFHLHLLDLRPDDPADFSVTLFKETIGIRSWFGPVGRSRLRLGDHVHPEFSRRAIFPQYIEAKATGEVRIDAVRGRHNNEIVAYDRLVLPLRTTTNCIEYAVSIAAIDFNLPAGDTGEQTLTSQQRTILRLLVHGYENREIARRLGLSAAELEHGCGRIIAALGARNLMHAVALATARGGEIAPDRPLSAPRPLRPSTLMDDLLARRNEGIVLVDGKGRVMGINGTAEEIMSRGGLRLVRGALRTERPEEGASLLQSIADCVTDPNPLQRFAIASRPGRTPLSLLVCRLPPDTTAALAEGAGIAVFITDPERVPLPTFAQLQQQFGLTLTEANVALEMLNGEGVATVAERLGVAAGTAKVHLAQVFAKTGTRRQAQLVRLLLSLRHPADAPHTRRPR